MKSALITGGSSLKLVSHASVFFKINSTCTCTVKKSNFTGTTNCIHVLVAYKSFFNSIHVIIDSGLSLENVIGVRSELSRWLKRIVVA